MGEITATAQAPAIQQEKAATPTVRLGSVLVPDNSTAAGNAANCAGGAPCGILYPMHNERDHYWPAGGIPPHRKQEELAYTHSTDKDRDGPFAATTPGLDAQTLAQEAAAMSSQPLKNSIAGAGAGCVSSVVTCPLDVVKTRLQYQGVLQEKYLRQGYMPYRGTFNTLGRILSEEGVRGLYRGLAPMLMGYLPTWGIYFTVYEDLKSKLSTQAENPLIGHTGVHIVSAMSAGATTSLLTNPIWVLKSRFMTQNAFTDYRYNSMWHAVK
ncbi:hypothetical protein GGI12_005818, partial [Dipsacomyces acuminosporus]